MLELEYTNVLDSAIGAQGIPKRAFEKASESSKHVIETLEAARTAGTLGFMDLPFDEAPAKAVRDFAKSREYPIVLVLGIGGSALGPIALDSALAKPNSPKRL